MTRPTALRPSSAGTACARSMASRYAHSSAALLQFGFEEPDPRFTIRELGTLFFHHIFGSFRCESWTCKKVPRPFRQVQRFGEVAVEPRALCFRIALDDESHCDAAHHGGRPFVLARPDVRPSQLADQVQVLSHRLCVAAQ